MTKGEILKNKLESIFPFDNDVNELKSPDESLQLILQNLKSDEKTTEKFKNEND